MTKLDIFDLEMKIMKYFHQLQKHIQNTMLFENMLEIQENIIVNYLLIIIQEIKHTFQKGFI